jgi:cobalamin biosynthesis protein CobT
MTRKTLFAVAMVLAMVGAPLTGAVAAADSTLAVDVTQEDGEVTVSVTQNGTGAGNALVLVETVDNGTYNETGNYTADADGELELSAPDENVTVNVTAEAGNDTAMTTTELLAVEENETDDNETADNETDSFGQRVSAFVHALQDDENVTRLGPHVAAFVTANNPGNAPDHAGPPAFVVGDDDSEDDADDNETDDNETADNEDDERGPPAHAGPPEDRGDDDGDDEEAEDDADDEEEREEDEADEEEDEADDDEESEDEDDDDDDGERGPPEGAGPPDHAGGD